MRILVLTLMLSFLSHSAFGAAEGGTSLLGKEELEEKYPLDPKSSPLIYRIAKSGNLEDCKAFDKIGCEKTNIRSKNGFYPSHAAATSSNPSIIFWLAKNGYGDLTATPSSSNNFMPVHYLLCNENLSSEGVLALAKKLDIKTREKALANKKVLKDTLKKIRDRHGNEFSFILAACLCEGLFTFKATRTDFQEKLRTGRDVFISSTESCCCKEFLAFILYLLEQKYNFIPINTEDKNPEIITKAEASVQKHGLLEKQQPIDKKQVLEHTLRRFMNFETAYNLAYDKDLPRLDLKEHALNISIIYFIKTIRVPGFNDFNEISHFALLVNMDGVFYLIHQPEPDRYDGHIEGVKVEPAQGYIEKWVKTDGVFFGFPGDEYLYSYIQFILLLGFLEKTQERIQ